MPFWIPHQKITSSLCIETQDRAPFSYFFLDPLHGIDVGPGDNEEEIAFIYFRENDTVSVQYPLSLQVKTAWIAILDSKMEVNKIVALYQYVCKAGSGDHGIPPDTTGRRGRNGEGAEIAAVFYPWMYPGYPPYYGVLSSGSLK